MHTFSWLSHLWPALTVLQLFPFKESYVFHTLDLPNPLNCWSGVSPRIKLSCAVNKGQECIKHPNPFTCNGGTRALWLPKCIALKWKGLFFALVLFHSEPWVCVGRGGGDIYCLYLSATSSPASNCDVAELENLYLFVDRVNSEPFWLRTPPAPPTTPPPAPPHHTPNIWSL